MKDCYIINASETAAACRRMDNATVRGLWRGFTLTKGKIEIEPREEFVFKIGDMPAPELPDGKEFAFEANENGMAVSGADYGGLMRGVFSLLMKLEHENGVTFVRKTKEYSDYKFANRMIHICVFPENDLYFIKKLIRLAAVCQYTHIVIEFWGMLKYDCMRELAWQNAFSKAEARELIDECNNLGIEPIPMFNQLGHATASRVCYGKHVVLDQNPTLQELFTPDGWAWNIFSDETEKLLKQVRRELYELFGNGEYMHIGCDEAYCISKNDKARAYLPKYLNKLTNEVEKEGRRPMMWMDMLLEEGKFPGCYATARADEAETLRRAVSKSTVFVDWQYDCQAAPIPSLDSLKNSPHDCMGAPWFEPKNYAAHIDTVSKNSMLGIMLTTWHELKYHMPSILDCARLMGSKGFVWSNNGAYEETAALLRRIGFEGGNYEDFGWSKLQIEV